MTRSRAIWKLRFGVKHPVAVAKLLLGGRGSFANWDRQRCKEFYDKSSTINIRDGLQKIGVVQPFPFDSLVNELLQRVADHRDRSNLEFYEKISSPSACYAWVLYCLVRHIVPQTVVETGVHRGVSSTAILQGLNDNKEGILYSIEKSAAGIGDLIPETLKNRWTLIVGDSNEQLPRLFRELGQVQLFFHDSLHTKKHMLFELTSAANSLAPGGLVAADNIESNDAFSTLFSDGEKWKSAAIAYSPEHKLGVATRVVSE